MVTVKLVQITKFQWQLVAPKGTIIQDDLSFANTYQAEEWAKKYISSFMNWNFETIPLTKDVK